MTGGIIPFRWAASSRFGGRLRSESAQNAPGVAEPGMKADAALGRFGLEVRREVADTQGHGVFPGTVKLTDNSGFCGNLGS